MIFLSHNHKDKAIVEQIAVRLRDIFSQDEIFYDSWSMQPGDGIIDKMNEGITDCKVFLFFVSKNSLQSNMVKLEWQNALYKATKGETKIIPVKLDDCLMPQILMQNIYIDLYNNGLEVALRQIFDVVSGKNTFRNGIQTFSNLKAYMYKVGEKIKIECHAEHYLEPISNFLFLTTNSNDEVSFMCKSSGMVRSGFNNDITLNNGTKCNAQLLAIEKGTVPGFPFEVEVTQTKDIKLNIIGVMHEKERNNWSRIPLIHGMRK